MADAERSSMELMSDVKPAKFFQFFTTLSVTMGALCFGTCLGYMSPAQSTLNETLTSDDEITWFSSSINLGAIAGGPVGGLLIDVLGRRGTMMASVLLSYGGWALIGFGQNFAALLSGRIITGLFMGMTSLAVPTYIGEIASADIRGTLGASFQLMVVIGILYAYLFGAVVDEYRALAGVCIAPTVVYTILIFFIKESPTFLYAKGKEKQARQALQALRGKHYNTEAEFQQIHETQEILSRSNTTWRDLTQRHILKPIVICLLAMAFQQASGVNAVLFNLGAIFESSGSNMDDNISAILVGAVQVVATLVAVFLTDRAGRKILLTGSAIVMTISIVSLGVSFYLDDDAPGWLPLASLCIFVIAFSLGYGPIPWVLMGELFTLEVRAAASSMATFCSWGVSFIVTLIYDPLKNAVHEYGTFWIFGVICAINVVFCVLVVPETKGKTIQQISEYFGAPPLPTEEKPSDEKNTNEERF